MEPTGLNRKLTAILSADVKGYSRLMRSDEEATVRTLTKYRSAITKLVLKYQGRVVDSPGDNILAEFASVVHAVQCSFDIQASLQSENAKLSEDRRMEFRIGINLGDVILDGERIYGDGVNVAARMESLAEAGGICVSGSAYDQIENKLAFGCEYLGEQTVKNISTPIRVYRLSSDETGNGCIVRTQVRNPSSRLIFAVVFGFLIISVGGFLSWNIYQGPTVEKVEPASVDNMAYPLPDKPSIAVLPFINMSDDAEQEYFCDGVTEDLITDLSKISGLFVIARNSIFTYKGRAVKIRQVAEELGVRYVLEGSVRRSKGQVRINAQLVDATTGGHLWANRYDGEMENIFALQDAITQKIVSALEVQLPGREEEQATSQETNNPEAYDAFLKGWAHYRKKTVNDAKLGITYLENAIKLDTSYTLAYAALAGVYLDIFSREWYERLKLTSLECRVQAKELLQKSMNNPHSLTYQVSSRLYIYYRKHEMAITDAEQAIAMDPNDPESYAAMANALVFSGRAEEALTYIKKAMRLDPHYPPSYLSTLGLAYFGMDKFKEAADSFERCREREPDDFWRIEALIASYALLGNEVKAKAMADKFIKSIYHIPSSFMIGKLITS